jgi:hypothetical protein
LIADTVLFGVPTPGNKKHAEAGMSCGEGRNKSWGGAGWCNTNRLESIYSNRAFHPLPLWIFHPGCSLIVLFVRAIGVGWLGSARQKNRLWP